MFRAMMLLGVFTGLLVGCAATQTAAKKPGCCAECLVCKKNADLACVEVEVNAKTPRADFAGKTYYFCSDECKAEFQKNPTKYLSKADTR